MDVRTGDLMDQEYAPKSFDVVRMSHVLEHLPDPMPELRRMHEILKDDGLLAIMIPNIGSALAHRFGDCWFALDAPRHLYSFSRKTVTKLLEKVGFRVERITQDWNACTLRQSLRYVDKERGGLLPKLADVGFDGVESITTGPVGDVEIEELRDLCGEHDTIIWGGIPGAMFSPPWTAEQVRENTVRLLDELAPDNRLIVGSADQVPPDGDMDFCRMIADTIAEWAGA